jgi:hypothetical protein
MAPGVQPYDLGSLDKRVLLSGAGLSRNWGGYLAAEMWGAIFSDPKIQRNERLRDLLLGDMDFEAVLPRVQTADEFEADRLEMNEAVRAAFRLQDANNCHALSGPVSSSWTRFSEGVIRRMVGADNHRAELSSFFFTLNQDILLERGFAPPTPNPPHIPGVQTNDAFWKRPREGTARMERYDDQTHGVLVSPAPELTFDLRERFNYIKLHGSFNWIGGDREMMVLGGGKTELISRFPLLSAYFDLFRQVLTSGNARLLVLGYGFKDDHVNQVIADAVRHSGLRLVVVDPGPGDMLHERLQKAGIWSGLADLISRPLDELFATDWGASLSGEYQRLQRSFLDVR